MSTFVAPVAEHRLRRLWARATKPARACGWRRSSGSCCITGEYRHKVITTSHPAHPRSARAAVAKAVASVVWGHRPRGGEACSSRGLGIPLLVTKAARSSALFSARRGRSSRLLGAFASLPVGLGFGTLHQEPGGRRARHPRHRVPHRPIITGLLPSGPLAAVGRRFGGRRGIARGNQNEPTCCRGGSRSGPRRLGIVPPCSATSRPFRRDVT